MRGAYYLQGGIMTADWTGWAVLYWSFLAVTACWILFLVLVCVRGAWRWWQMRDSDRW